MITYDSGSDSHYIIEADRKRAWLPILQKPNQQVGVANGGIIKGQYITKPPFQQLSETAAQAATFNEFLTSLMSVGKTCDDGNISIFTEYGVKVHKENNIIITCKGAPILVYVRDEHGQ